MTHHDGNLTTQAAPISDDDRLTFHHRQMLAAREHLRQAAELTGDKDVQRMALCLRSYLGAGLYNADEYSILGDEIETAATRMVRRCRDGAGAA